MRREALEIWTLSSSRISTLPLLFPLILVLLYEEQQAVVDGKIGLSSPY